MAIKKILHIADLHARTTKRLDETREQLQKFVDEAKRVVSEHDEGEVAIVICGDLTHQKSHISSEQLLLISWFLKELDLITTTIVIAGNHDILEGNLERTDTLSALFTMNVFERVVYLDQVTGYQSACLDDEEGGITWALFSIFDGYRCPDIEKAKENGKGKPVIGLFHGPIVGSDTDSGYKMEKGLSADLFGGCDFVLCGDIHRRQTLRVGGVEMFYPGTLFQQSYGETVSNHGYNVIDVKTKKCEFVEISTDYGFYKFKVESLEEVEQGKERLLNL